jgi:hypothetical protein
MYMYIYIHMYMYIYLYINICNLGQLKCISGKYYGKMVLFYLLRIFVLESMQCMNACLCIYMYIHIHICKRINTHLQINMFICVYICIQML